MKISKILVALVASSAATIAGAQTGTDACTTPDAIAGQGSFAFDNSLATTGIEGQVEGICYAFGSSAVDNDVWFSWTADATGVALIGTCTAITVDTKLASYPGSGCPTNGSSLACNDDSCGLQSTINFSVTTGTTYTLQMGTFPGALGGTGTMDISILPPVANDDCAAPTVLAGQGSFAFNTLGATTGLEGQNEALCYAAGASAVDSDVWYSWTADATGVAVINTCNSVVDTVLASYPGGGCPTNGSAIACNDQSCGNQSSITFPVTNGTAYMLQVGVWPGAASGTGTVDIAIFPPAPNDDCAAPTVIAGQGSFAFSQIGATTGAEGQNETLCYTSGASSVEFDVWYSWTADATGVALVNTCNSVVDTVLASYPGGGCPANGTALDCNDQSCGNQSAIAFPVTNGTAYMLQVGSWPGAASGTGTVDINIVPPAPNDNCAAPSVIAGQGSFPFSQIGSTTGLEGQNEPNCYFFGSSVIDNDVWYTWTADASGTAIIATCNSVIDTKIAAYPGTGCPTAGSSLACNDDACGLQTQVLLNVTNGTTYTLQVGNFPGAAGGTGTMDITIVPPLTSDDCATPDAIAGQGTFAYNSTIATTGSEGQNETICYDFGSSNIDNDVWYAWTSNATGPATISTCNGATMDTKIAAYPGNGCPTIGSALACNDDTCGLQSEIIFPAVAGTTYTLQIGNFPGAGGGTASFDISVQGPAEPGNAYCFCDTGNSPCGNPGVAGNGCANSSGTNGANLTGSGVAIVGSDSLVLSASGLAPGQPGLYFQGNNAVGGGAGIIFGDGVRCAGNSVVRLGVANSDAGGISDTSAFPQTISVKGGVTAGDLRYYQLWYRDPIGSPCGALFNLTNGYSIQW